MADKNVKAARNEHPQGLALTFLADSATRRSRERVEGKTNLQKKWCFILLLETLLNIFLVEFFS